MSDNLRRYRAIRAALTQWYPGDPKAILRRGNVSVVFKTVPNRNVYFGPEKSRLN